MIQHGHGVQDEASNYLYLRWLWFGFEIMGHGKYVMLLSPNAMEYRFVEIGRRRSSLVDVRVMVRFCPWLNDVGRGVR